MAEKPTKKRPNKLARKIVRDNENGARQAILEDLFFDFHRSRRQVYWMNFIRGIFFGIGSALGATLLITLLAWLLGQFADIFPPLADFINHLIETMQHRQVKALLVLGWVAIKARTRRYVRLDTKDRLDTSLFGSFIIVKDTAHRAVVGYCRRFHAELFNLINQIIDFSQAV